MSATNSSWERATTARAGRVPLGGEAALVLDPAALRELPALQVAEADSLHPAVRLVVEQLLLDSIVGQVKPDAHPGDVGIPLIVRVWP